MLGLQKSHFGGARAMIPQDRSLSSISDGSPTTPTASPFDMNTSMASYGLHHDNQSMTTADGDEIREHHTQTTVVKTTRTVQRLLVAEIDSIDEAYFGTVSIEDFVEWINTERLLSMPHEGSHWDRTLKATEFFGLQVAAYADKIETFAPGSQDGAKTTIANCLLLLQLGAKSAQALEATFATFYKLGLTLSFFMRNENLFHVDPHIKTELGLIYCDLLNLVAEVTVYYLVRLSTSKISVVVDFTATFGHSINKISRRKDHIADAMWNGALHGQVKLDIRTIREWLSPRDKVIQLLALDRLERGDRTEHTCEWAQKHLLDFLRSKDQTLSLTAPPGHGKTTLSKWVAERLQRPLGRRSYQTISFTFETDIPSECTSIALIKSMLAQLLELNVGNVKFYTRLVEAYKMTLTSRDAVKFEAALWKALRSGLESFAEANITLIILIDGLDEVLGGNSATSKLFGHLHELAVAYAHVRAVILSNQISLPASQGIRSLPITPDHTRDDLRRLVLDVLPKYQEQPHLEKLVEELVHAARGSFLWMKLVLRGITSDDAHDVLHKAIKEAPKTQHEQIDVFLSRMHLKASDTRSLISWMLVTERPLTVGELSLLLRIDLSKHSLSETSSEVAQIIKEQVSTCVYVKNGIVRFRHNSLRQGLIELSGKSRQLSPMKEAHRDLTLRMLLYNKLCYSSCEPSLDPVEVSTANGIFRRYHLLEYTTRYWLLSLRKSSFYGEKGSFECTADLKALFPTSPLGPLLEWSLWETQTSALEALDLHSLSLSIRRQVVGDNHKATLQCLLILGNFHKKLSHTIELGDCMYQASVTAQVVLNKFNSIAVRCSSMFLECTENITSTTRTEIITRKEVMLKFMISVCKYQHGARSEIVINFLNILAKLYVDIHEEHHAQVIYDEIHEIVIHVHGKYSDQAQATEKLIIVLNKDKKRKEVTSLIGSIFEIHEEIVEITDVRKIVLILTSAESYEARGEVFLAEEIFINLWRRVIEMCRTEISVEVQIAKIDVTLAYVRFLHRHHRHAEASAILICVWEDFEQSLFESEIIVIRLKAVGELMRSVGLLSFSLSVFKSVWSYFKRESRTSHAEAISTTTLISETVEELILKSTETSTSTTRTETTTLVSTEIEVTIREIFESATSEVHSTESHTRLIKASTSLVALYIHEERWSQATKVIRQTLEVVWKVVISGIGMIALPEVCISECISIAIKLAQCYNRQKLFEKAEQIYIRVYQACIFSLDIEDERVSKAVSMLIAFYEEYHCHDKSIEIYVDLVHAYRRQFGTTHTLTIKTLYTLASLLIRFGRKRGYEYYLEIVTSLNKGSHICHHEAFEAAVILVRWYYEEERWTDVKQFCEIICATFVHQHGKRKFQADVVEFIYEKYLSVLEVHMKTEFMVLRKVVLEYRDTCIKMFGASASVTITATVQLATICERQEEYHHEAISIYEELIKRSTSVTITKVTEIKQNLSKLYVKVITSSTSTTVSSTTVERAISLTTEKYEETKVRFGCWHETTLTVLSEVIMLYRRLKTTDSHTKITTMLRAVIVDILTNETSSHRLYHAALGLAKIFFASELIEFGFHIIRTIRGQLLLHNKSDEESLHINIERHKGKLCYIFFVAFELGLRGSVSVSYTEVMAEILTESLLVERYTQLIESKATIEVIIQHGARLRHFLAVQHRQHQLKIIEEQLYASFTKRWKCEQTEYTLMFFTCLLEEIGKAKATLDIHHAAAIASVEKVKKLLEHGQFQQAYEFALCAFQFLGTERAYHHILHIPFGFKLSQLMAGRLVARTPDAKLQHRMLELSKSIIRDIFQVCKESDIDLIQLSYSDLDDLVGLLGDQHNLPDLEWLLKKLWNSRDIQKSWTREQVIGVGRALVQACFSQGKKSHAVRLCEDMCYNLRRARGALYPPTLEMYQLLASLYTSAGHFRETMALHEDILRRELDGDDDEGDYKQSGEEAARTVNRHLELLKRAHQRLGGWDRSETVYQTLYASAKRSFGSKISIQPLDKWPSDAKGLDDVDKYAPPAHWTINSFLAVTGKMLNPHSHVNRARSSYGLNQIICLAEEKHPQLGVSEVEVDGVAV